MEYPTDRWVEIWPGLRVARTYSEEVKTDLWSTAIEVDGAWWVFDPTPLGVELTPSAGVVLTNANHERAASMLTGPDIPIITRHSLSRLPSNFESIEISGGAEGEIAVLVNLPSAKVCVVGDALINMPPKYPLMYLPDKYCEDPARLRQTARGLLSWKIDILCFAHGEPMLSDVPSQLEQLFS